MANVKEQVEAKAAVEAVAKADKKIEDIKAQRAADKAKKHAERIEKHPKLGKAINWVDDHKWQIAAGAATGGVSFAAGWFGHKFFGKNDAEVTVDVSIDEETASNEASEAPFDA